MVLLIGMTLLAACGKQASDESNGASGTDQSEKGRISVVTSFYPIYFFAGAIGGEHAEVVNLIPAGVEPHDWSPKPRDLDRAAKAQLFLYNGAGLEGWVDDFLEGLGKDVQVTAMAVSEGIELIDGDAEAEAEAAHEEEGHEEEGHEEDGHGHEEDAHGHEENAAHEEEEHVEDDHGHSHTVDPHTWVSPKSAIIMAENIKNSFIEADPANKEAYTANYEALKQKLAALDEKFTLELAQTASKDIVVSHQAFGYLCRDYGLNQVAIMGLSAEAEPLPQDLLRIANFVKENEIQYIFFEELVSDQLAKTLAREAKVDTLVLNPLEGLTPEQEKAGENYISLMEVNLQNLLKALQ
ncbi:metal ABC transporter solute-binding protein, Zn/Mn family [Paenibacillus tarimensis]